MGKQPSQELELVRAYGAGGDEAGPQPGVGGDGGHPGDLDPAEQVRLWSSEKLRTFIHNLEPYINGTFGVVSTKHGQLYMAALRELNRIWSAQYRLPPQLPPAPDESEVEQVRMEEARKVRERVLDQLTELRNRSGS